MNQGPDHVCKLTGTVDHISDPHVVIDVQGVGYLVATSSRTRGRLNVGEAARLFIETTVREDAINLYGFIDGEEQAWFRLLTSVQGVGPRVGLAILSACAPSDMMLALASGDKTVFTRADGVGPKLATRLVTELKDKAPDYMPGAFAPLPGTAPKGQGPAPVAMAAGPSQNNAADGGAVDADAVSALVNLGYGRAEAFAAVMRVKSTSAPTSVALMIKLSLGELTKGNAA